VTAAIVGARNAEQVNGIVSAAALRLTQSDVDAIENVAEFAA